MSVFKNSRFSVGLNVYYDKDNDTPYLETPTTEIPIDGSDYIYQIKGAETLEFLANQFYGNPQLKWIILYANPNYMSESDIQVGDNLNIPRKDKVMRYVNSRL